MVCCRGIQFIVLQATDRTVHFEHSQSYIAIAVDPVFAQRALEFIHTDSLFGHVLRDDAAFVDEQRRLAFD
jgi:hypothetical protein